MNAARSRKDAVTPIAGSFGFDPKESVSHFLVEIPASNQKDVYISEHLSWEAETGSSHVTLGVDSDDGQVRIRLPRAKWNEISDALRTEFNQRLKHQGKRPGKWAVGKNLVSRLLGKEMTLLAWAIEDADPSLIPAAVANWIGLAPEERWWLYTMTAAATGHFTTGRGRGWRKAVRFALTENPVSGMGDRPVVPEFFRLISDHEKQEQNSSSDEE